VSLIIPTRNSHGVLRVCIDSIREKTTYSNYEIIVVDNGSDDPESLYYFRELEYHGIARILRYDKPFNYSAINNFAVAHARGELVGLINNDMEVISPGWLDEIVSLALLPGTGCVGAKLYYPNETIQHAGVILGLGGVAGHSHKHAPRIRRGYFGRLHLVQNISAVTAACLIVRKSIYEEVGGLDADNLAVAFNDVDFCLRVTQAGYTNAWTPHAELYHHESLSRGAEDSPEKQKRFEGEVLYMKARWGDKLMRDPYYSPNLTLRREDFSIGLD
jgi:GT2 family glycosyltransferase